jgi:hypothetical protein
LQIRPQITNLPYKAARHKRKNRSLRSRLGNERCVRPGLDREASCVGSTNPFCASAFTLSWFRKDRGKGKNPAPSTGGNPAPVLNNTCYSMITDKDSVHVASVHQYDPEKKTMLPVQGAGGLSPAMVALVCRARLSRQASD